MNAQKELDAAIAKVLLYAQPGTVTVMRMWLRVVVTAAQIVAIECNMKVKS